MNRIERTTLFLLVISLAAFAPVWAEQTMGPEIPVSVLDNQQFLPDVAYNNLHDEYLVVWHNDWGGNSDVYGQRVDGGGNLLSWFSISAGPHDRVQPSVAYDDINDRYLVVWAYDIVGNGSDWDIWGRLIPWNGPDPLLTEFAIEWSTSNQLVPEVAFAYTQQEFMVVWNNIGAVPINVTGRRIGLDGSFPSGSFVSIASGATDRTFPDIAYNLARNEYLVTYDLAGVDILGTRLTAGGTILGTGEFAIADWPSPESRPAVAACKGGADQFFVAWQSLNSPGADEVYGRFVTGAGVPGNVVYISGTTGDERAVDVTCHTPLQEYLVVYEGEYIGGSFGTLGKRLTTDGRMTPEMVIRSPNPNETTPAAAAGRDGGFLVVWEHDRPGTGFQDIHGRIITAPFFTDGFESGNHGAWSVVVP